MSRIVAALLAAVALLTVSAVSAPADAASVKMSRKGSDQLCC
jgi:hypothetical protein